MNDPALHRLVTALDGMFDIPLDLRHDLDAAAERLRCLGRMGVLADDSPYIAFVRRTFDDQRQTVLAASA
jgi:hypothetical protein